MLLDLDRRALIRASVEHLDSALYERLEAGDQLVIYRKNWPLMLVPEEHSEIRRKLQRILDELALRNLACSTLDDGPTRMVWEIVYAEPAERAAE